jgi:hypothetical protein
MNTTRPVPKGITNIPAWEEHCRKIHARASDLVDGKVSVIQTALALQKLTILAHLDTDEDLGVFHGICGDALALPVGAERQQWNKHALQREDAKIEALEQRWKSAANSAATRLIDRYRWALDARQRRRSSGNVV